MNSKQPLHFLIHDEISSAFASDIIRHLQYHNMAIQDQVSYQEAYIIFLNLQSVPAKEINTVITELRYSLTSNPDIYSDFH